MLFGELICFLVVVRFKTPFCSICFVAAFSISRRQPQINFPDAGTSAEIREKEKIGSKSLILEK